MPKDAIVRRAYFCDEDGRDCVGKMHAVIHSLEFDICADGECLPIKMLETDPPIEPELRDKMYADGEIARAAGIKVEGLPASSPRIRRFYDEEPHADQS